MTNIDSINWLVKEYNLTIIAEIGVLEGNLTRGILSKSRDALGLYLLVDPWKCYDELDMKGELYGNTQLDWENRYNRVVARLKDETKIKILREFSTDAAKRFGCIFDLVYIDGNHNLPFVKDDINAWWPKVVKGGILAGHDYSIFDSVELSVNEFAKNNSLQVNFLEDEGLIDKSVALGRPDAWKTAIWWVKKEV
jgi:hypothetical protein